MSKFFFFLPKVKKMKIPFIAKNRSFQWKTEKVNITIEFCIFELV